MGPPPADGDGAVFRLRDLPQAPRRGVCLGVPWLHFEAALQLRVRLRGSEWRGLTERAFCVKVGPTELAAKCSNFHVMDELHLKLAREVDPARCRFCLEASGSVEDDGVEAEGKGVGGGFGGRVLLIELAKKEAGEAWPRRPFSESTRSPEERRMLFEVDGSGWRAAKVLRRAEEDEADAFVASREQLCKELQTGQTEESVQLRLLLDEEAYTAALAKTPAHRLWALDVSRRHVRLFIRGDRSKPVVCGRLKGACQPDRCSLSLGTAESPNVEDDGPCLDLVIVKADDSYFDWGRDPIDYGAPEPTEEGGKEEVAPEPIPLEGSAGAAEWLQELRERAAASFKAGNYAEAAELYTRLLQAVPNSERLLANRSAAYLKAGKAQLALEDATKAQALAPAFAKTFFRRGQALQALGRHREALQAFRDGAARDEEESPEWNREVLRTKHLQRDVREKRGSWV